MQKLTLVWLSVVCFGLASFFLAGSLVGVTLQEVTPDKVGAALMSLLFVALLIERAVEVFVSPVTSDEKQALVSEQAQVQSRLTDIKAALLPATDPALPVLLPAQIELLKSELAQKTARQLAIPNEIAGVDRKTQKYALSFSVPISLAVALAGVRALDVFLPGSWVLNGAVVPAGTAQAVFQRGLNGGQLGLFTTVDVILTAALLAGGADGVHKILDRFIKLASGKDVQQPIK